ncbi:MAG: hypothetical protein PHW36_00810 [Bacilli bacterium]|nr:hypothetical protein [Bacilli bacterium]
MTNEKQIEAAILKLRKANRQLKTLAMAADRARVKAEATAQDYDVKQKKLLAFGKKHDKLTDDLRSRGIYSEVVRRV